MTNRTGVCPNVGPCDNANYNRQFVIPGDREFQCPSCHSNLREVAGGQGALSGSLKYILPLLVFAGVVGLSIFAYQRWRSSQKTTTPMHGTNQVAGGTPAAASTNCKGMPMHKNVMADIRNRGYLIMGVQASAPPMNNSPDTDEWDEEKGEEARRKKELSWTREGFDYELATMIVEQMGFIHKGKSVRAREIPEFKDLFCLLNRQEPDGSFSVDIIMSGIARDSSYDDTISWTRPYLDIGYALITKKSSNIETLDECKDKKIGIVNGDNIVKAYVNSQLTNPQLVELSDESDEWLSDALNLNQVDAVVYDYPFAVEEVKGINEQVKEKGIVGKALEIRVARLPNSEPKYSIGVPKGEDELLERLNDAIEKVTAEDNPRYAALIQKYLSSKDIKQVKIPPGANVYTVLKGDSLARIAARELGDEKRWRELAALNNIGNDHLIVPNQKLILPK